MDQISNIKESFREQDKTGEGLITLDALKSLYTRIDGTWTEEMFVNMFAVLNKTPDGKVKYDDFLDFVWADSTPQEKDDLVTAVELLDSHALIKEKLPGLGAALLRLPKVKPVPDDVTMWLYAQLRATRPSEVREHEEPILQGLVMKHDEFTKIHLLKSERLHTGTWNFRKTDIPDLPIYGSGQCHLDGILFLAKHLKTEGYNKVLWFNMREEPVVFLSGQACAPRSENSMNDNIDWLMSVERHELAAIEERLLRDCIERADQEESKTMGVFYQLASGGNEERQLPVTAKCSFTVRGAYEWLKEQDGVPKLIYSRVPICDEVAPEEPDFDQLVMELRSIACSEVAKDIALVFNCHMGRGRTTTGMVCGAILMLAGRGWRCPDDVHARIPLPTEERNLNRGEFKCILQLLSLIDKASTSRNRASFAEQGRGLRAKLLVDYCIDNCAHAQNMLEAISHCESSAAKAEPGSSRPPEMWRNRARAYLHRYVHLLLFAAYALEEVKYGFETIFSQWFHRHWQFRRIIKNLSLE